MRIRVTNAGVAQVVEQRIRNAWVGGSNPSTGTIFSRNVVTFRAPESSRTPPIRAADHHNQVRYCARRAQSLERQRQPEGQGAQRRSNPSTGTIFSRNVVTFRAPESSRTPPIRAADHHNQVRYCARRAQSLERQRQPEGQGAQRRSNPSTGTISSKNSDCWRPPSSAMAPFEPPTTTIGSNRAAQPRAHWRASAGNPSVGTMNSSKPRNIVLPPSVIGPQVEPPTINNRFEPNGGVFESGQQ